MILDPVPKRVVVTFLLDRTKLLSQDQEHQSMCSISETKFSAEQRSSCTKHTRCREPGTYRPVSSGKYSCGETHVDPEKRCRHPKLRELHVKQAESGYAV